MQQNFLQSWFYVNNTIEKDNVESFYLKYRYFYFLNVLAMVFRNTLDKY